MNCTARNSLQEYFNRDTMIFIERNAFWTVRLYQLFTLNVLSHNIIYLCQRSVYCIDNACLLCVSKLSAFPRHKDNAERALVEFWRQQMETFSALLAICAGKSPVTGESPSQRPVTRSFDVFFDLRRNKRLSKERRRWFETSRSLWRHCSRLYSS